MRATVAAIAAALLLVASSATATADPPGYFYLATAKAGDHPTMWLQCYYRGTWNALSSHQLPTSDDEQLWVVGLHLAGQIPATVADAYVCMPNTPDDPDVFVDPLVRP